MPLFECLDRRFVIESALRDAVVVGLEVVMQRRFELGRGTKTSLSNDLVNVAIEALYRAVPWPVDGGAE